MGDGDVILAWEQALERVGGDREFLGELVGCFLVDLEGYLADLREAPDPESRRAAAHRIKGAARNLGALALAEACRRAEESGEEQAVAAVEREARRLVAHWKSPRSPAGPGNQAG
ncbi:Hpt domain-containing protein [Deferrisoma camini]|uniref:Hpt domain-containing protein n=1 Tax=Deferrisoma camini TaxID=1035120 RepID=UPI0004BC60F7|nr:Hpt domain-containing protein [Deferrisoma camini]